MAPYNNIVGQYMRLRDPENGDFRPLEGSDAEAYGCQTFVSNQSEKLNGEVSNLPQEGILVSGSRADVGGLISEPTTWDADIIRVVETVEVAEDASLTISPGTRVEFDGFFRLLVQGRLWAVGEAENRIEFTTTIEQSIDGWDGIDFLNIPAVNDSSRLEHCHISNAVARPNKNGTHRPQTGGAISIVGVNKLAIASCEFDNNKADYGAAVYCGYGSSPVFAGNLFHHNIARWNGSALFNVYAYPKLINNTIVENTCLEENNAYECGAVENFNGKILMINNIIRDNFSNHYSGTQLVGYKDYYTLANNIEAYEGNETNLDVDPDFIGEGSFRYLLAEGSPCIDLGLNDPLTSVLAAHDLLGHDRLCGAGLDLGAFEFCDGVSSVEAISSTLFATCVPNPFNPRTRIVFNLPQAGLVNLAVYDLKGRLVRTLVNDWHVAGRQEIVWNGCDSAERSMASGQYLYRLQMGEQSITKTMTLVR